MTCCKWFDKVIAQSSMGQFVAFAVALAAMILAGALVGHFVLDRANADNAKFGRPATWGLMQCVDGGFVDATITTNTQTDDKGTITREAPLYVIFLSLGFWLAGAILMSFFTGAAANFLDARREKIRTGDVDYAFEKDYILIVGYDFQVKNLIRKLLRDHPKESVVLVTDSPVDVINDDILPEIGAADERRFFAMRKEIADDASYRKFRILGAKRIYLIGDGDSSGRDGRILKAQGLIAMKAQAELGYLASGAPIELPKEFQPIPLYLHIEDSVLYTQIRSIDLPSDPIVVSAGKKNEKGEDEKCPVFRTEVFNYYESWAWQCWARKRADADYPRLLHIPGTKRAELFVIGAGRMGRAMVNFALPLLNYGLDTKSRITIFDANPLKKGFLPDRAVLENMPEVDVCYSVVDGCSDEANELMLEAAKREDTSVTVVIALKNPDAAIRAYSELSNRLRRRDISVLVWQATGKDECPDREFLRMGGRSCTAEKAKVWYFGMTDTLPWENVDERSKWGAAVDYYYDTWFGSNPLPNSPSIFEDGFVRKSKDQWDEAAALEKWKTKDRWKKWASVSSADAFYERSAVVSDASSKEATLRLLKAEHNRWWTEKLLGGWLPDDNRKPGDESHADKQRMIHGDMVSFEELTEGVKDKDKINIAAMAACGFI